MKNEELVRLIKTNNKVFSESLLTVSGDVIAGGEGPFDIEGDIVVGAISAFHYVDPMWEGNLRVSGSIIATQ